MLWNVRLHKLGFQKTSVTVQRKGCCEEQPISRVSPSQSWGCWRLWLHMKRCDKTCCRVSADALGSRNLILLIESLSAGDKFRCFVDEFGSQRLIQVLLLCQSSLSGTRCSANCCCALCPSAPWRYTILNRRYSTCVHSERESDPGFSEHLKRTWWQLLIEGQIWNYDYWLILSTIIAFPHV
mgnify:CR=1 FL=1